MPPDAGGNYKLLPTDDPEPACRGVELTVLPVKGGDDLAEATDAIEDEETEDHDPRSLWSFVEKGWFQVITACVILVNTVIMILELDEPSNKETFYWPDQFILVFYVFELVSRVFLFKSRFCLGVAHLVAWNMLDIVVVSAGVFDQWLRPALSLNAHSLQTVLSLLRLLRLVRVLKIVRVFLEMDLSWTEQPKFQSFIGAVIAFNALLMGLETDIDWPGWFYIENVLLVIYVFELSVRLKRFGLSFLSWHNPDIIWNVLDFIIVVSSVLDSWLVPLIALIKRCVTGTAKEQKGKTGMSLGQVMMLLRMLRLMRILRLVKLVKSVRPLYILVMGVVQAFQGVVWVMVLTVGVLYAMGIMTTRLIGHEIIFSGQDAPDSVVEPFRTVPDSMFTLFRVMSGAASDKEQAAIDELMVSIPQIKFAFIFFMVTSSWTLLSILTAVVSDNMIATTGAQEQELNLSCADEDRQNHIRDLEVLFASMANCDDDGTLDERDLRNFLDNKENATSCAKLCRVPVREVKEVLQTLSIDGQRVAMRDFVECMVDVAATVTQKDIMKIESQFMKLERTTGESFELFYQKVVAITAKADELLGRYQACADAVNSLGEAVQTLLRKQDAFHSKSREAICSIHEMVVANCKDISSLASTLEAMEEKRRAEH
jgi:voltage-gated sodium channel